MYQHVMVMGHLGRDPEMRYTANGSAVATFSVATSRVWNNAQGEKQEETTWFNVVTWNRTAEIAAQYLQKGALVSVEGRIATRSYDDKDGVKRYVWELVASRLVLMPQGNRGDRQYGGAGENDRGGHLSREAQAQGAFPVSDAGGDIDPDDLPF